MTPVFTFWNDSPLGWVERLCLTSMVRAGHDVTLYSYSKSHDVPAGVRLRHASELIPESRIIRHERTGSISLFADIFRLEGLKAGLGIWLDADMLVLRSLDDMGDQIFGWESSTIINNAVLLLQPSSPTLKQLLELVDSKSPMPPYWDAKRRAYQRIRAAIGRPVTLSQMRWGVIGPLALTHFLTAGRDLCLAHPISTFYPVYHSEVELLLAPGDGVDRRLTSSTRAVHLWKSVLAPHLSAPVDPRSFLGRMCARFGIAS